MNPIIPWVDEGADPALAAAGLVGERGHAPVGQLFVQRSKSRFTESIL